MEPINRAVELINGHPLPPYGRLAQGYMQQLANELPPAFPGPLAAWRTFRDATVGLIQNTLWPVYDEISQTWVGPSAATMASFTGAELNIMAAIRSGGLWQSIPNSPAKDPACPAHSEFFRHEDQTEPKFFEKYGLYDKSRSPTQIAEFSDLLIKFVRGLGSTPLQFKVPFQRPRPYQTSLLMPATGKFSYKLAATAATPALCSGHTLQGLLGVGAVIESVVGTGFPPGSMVALQQFAVDIGDRRVFAGLHYPGDNLSSWIIGLRLADHVYKKPEVKTLLRQAILERSEVFRIIKDQPGYANALALL